MTNTGFRPEDAGDDIILVDPDNRLFADTLEAEWNEKLRQLQNDNDYYERHRQLESEKLKKAQEKQFIQLARVKGDVVDKGYKM